MRTGLLAAAAFVLISLSGCHELILQTFGDQPDDPPVHDTGANPGSATVSAREFTGRASGRLASRMRITHGFVKTRSNWARFIGTYRSSLTGSPFGSGQWHARFRTVRNRETGRFRITGLVLSTYTGATQGRACLSLTHKGRRAQNRRPRRRGLSTLTLLGGEGDARTLRGTATARVGLARDNSGVRVRGRVTTRRSTPRGFTSACTRLEKRFGLQPVPDS